MKSLFHFLALCFAFVCFSQTSNAQRLQSIYMYLQQQSPVLSGIIDSFEYNAQGQLNKHLTFMIDSNGTQILEDSRGFTYDVNNRITSELAFRRVMNSMDTSHRFDYTHDAQGRLVIQHIWFAPLGYGGGPLSLNAILTYKYNGQGKLDSVIQKTLVNGIWQNHSVKKLLYNATGLLTRQIELVRKVDSLELFEETFYAYDVQNRLDTLRIEKSHGRNATQPREIWEEVFYYAGHPSHSQLPDSIKRRVIREFSISHSLRVNHRLANDSLSEVLAYVGPPGNRTLQRRYHYNYALASNTNSELLLKTSVYPNPVSDQLYVLFNEPFFATATIMGSNGQTLKTLSILPGQSSIDMYDLPTGLYFLYLQSEGKTVVHKILKH